MDLRKEIEESLRRDDNEVDAVEDHMMRDSILAIASTDFREQDVLSLPLTTKKRQEIDISSSYPGKPSSRKAFGFEECAAPDTDEEEDSESCDESRQDELFSRHSDDSATGYVSEELEGEFHRFEDNECGVEEEEDGVEEQEDDVEEQEDGVEEEEEEEGVEAEDDSPDNSDAIDSEPEPPDQDEEVDEDEPSMKMFSTAPADSSEIQKGLAVKEQLRTWESLLECRIKFEPSLVATNQLYQLDRMTEYIAGHKFGTSPVQMAQNALQDLANSWQKLQVLLGENNSEAPRKRKVTVGRGQNDSDDDDDNESITSSEESSSSSEEEELSDPEDDAGGPPPPKKPKSSQPSSLSESYANFSSFRDTEIDKWNEKAKVSSGRAAQKDFSAFDQSILKLIESILYDKYRLVKKTQLKRLDYVIYGNQKRPTEQLLAKEPEDGSSQQTERLKKDLVYDPEIFDDGDFYQKLLRDFIDSKSTDSGVSKHERKLMELHRLRIKMKRKIDTRATKGRKLRYIVHPKLVNFMAPVPSNSFSAEAESQLMRSLFGQASANGC